eukprot:g6391.t1
MGKYPDYTGPLHVSGTVAVFGSYKGNMRLALSLSGLEEGISAGVHVHAGTTCSDASQVGGHFWDQSLGNDPWPTVKYTTLGNTYSSFETLHVNTDSISQSVIGHAVVVHDSNGTRVACGVLRLEPYDVIGKASLGPYPGYTGAEKAIGDVQVFGKGSTSVYLVNSLTGLTKDSSGGVHIHSGKSCAAASDVGGHYYKNSAGNDPWTAVQYVANGNGDVGTIHHVNSGIAAASLRGHAIVVHNGNGDRIACGLIEHKVDQHVHHRHSADASSIELNLFLLTALVFIVSQTI